MRERGRAAAGSGRLRAAHRSTHGARAAAGDRLANCERAESSGDDGWRDKLADLNSELRRKEGGAR